MNFLSELSRRNVIRVAGLYAIMGWIIVQVIATIAPMLGLPDWFGTAVLLLLMAGFPIVALGAWAFELTPEGLKRETSLAPGDAARTLNPLDIGILAGLAAVVIAALWLSFSRAPTIVAEAEPVADQTVAEEGTAATSIAVLAFQDLSEDQDQEYFADGISEEILNVLVRVEGLQVASRTSSFQFKGRSLGVAQIAEELGVGHVLEGSVRRAGDRIRITAQLIDARTDRHLWSENFDRDMTDIFAIQDEIADAIVAALADSLGLSPEDANVNVAVATENLDAYDAYIQGRELFLARANLPRATELLEHAVELDPEYVEVWETLAVAYVIIPSWDDEADQADYNARATDAANRALEIDPDSSMAYAALGAAVSNGTGGADEFILVEQNFTRAIELDPRNIVALDWLGTNLGGFGYLDEAYELFQRCVEVDPGYSRCLNELARLHVVRGEHELAIDAFWRSVESRYPRPGLDVFDSMIALGMREEAILLLGGEIGYDAPVAELVDALLDPTRQNAEDTLSQLRSFHEANPDRLSAGSLYHMAALLGVNSDMEITLEVLADFPSFWHPEMVAVRNSDAFREARQGFGLDEYWRERGFPPQCRPVGEDNIECD